MVTGKALLWASGKSALAGCHGALVVVPLAALLVGCGADSTGTGFGGGGGDGGGSPGSGVDGSGGALSGNDGGGRALSAGDASYGEGGSLDCPASAKLVYVTGQGSKLYSFYPPTLKFTLIGTLSCLGGNEPTHMTVDRTGTAWVVSNGGLFTASTANAACAAVPTWTPQLNDFSDFALTFLGTTNATDNTLYMLGADFTGAGVLGKLDVPSGTVTTIGMPNVATGRGDMTTNGDGTLYFLMNQYPATGIDLYELAPSNAAVLKSMVPNAPTGGDQALAFYGGSFYAFEDGEIYQFEPMTQVTTKLSQAPISVTGAGQSTCVPLVPPSSK